MKKLLIITTGITLLTLTSCSKEELVDCNKARINYEGEMRNAGSNWQQANLIDQKYRQKYPSCGF
jgi:hypothetical protein